MFIMKGDKKLKTIFKKITSLFLLTLLLTTAISAHQASARTTSSTSWGISLTQVATGVPYYSTYTPINLTDAHSASTYTLSSNCAIVQFKYNSNISSTWVWVDYFNILFLLLIKQIHPLMIQFIFAILK